MRRRAVTRLCHASLPLLMLIALALLARAAVPTGWMPMFGHGSIRIVLCSGYGPVTTLLDLTGDTHKGDPQHNHHHDPCPYGLALAKALDLPPAIALGLPPAALAALIGPAVVIARLVVWRSLRPPARGPPNQA